MSSGLLTMTVWVTIAAGPYGGCTTCGANGYGIGGGYAAGAGMPYGGAGSSYGADWGGGGGFGGPGPGQLHPYDGPEPWLHGYIQEMPAYGGFRYFRPYNYKHVMPQASVAAGWGMPAGMPYSQQFWHRYQDRATMRERQQTDADPRSSDQTTQLRTRSALSGQAPYGVDPRLVSGQSESYQAPNPATTTRSVDPAGHEAASHIRQLQQQLQQLSIQQQALQNALLQAHRPQGGPIVIGQ